MNGGAIGRGSEREADDFFAPRLKIDRTSERKPAEPLWSLTKGQEMYRAELRHNGEFGVELQLFLTDGHRDHFVYGQRYPIRAIAMSEANRLFDVYSDLDYKLM